MPPVKTQKKVRPSTASGALESHEFVDLLDDLRPATAPGKNLLGLDPTYVTSRHHVPGVPITSKLRGRQIFGGIPENDLKGAQGRRATLGGLEDVEEHEKPKRPATAVGVSKQIKLEDRITLDHLNKMRQAFEEADSDGNGTLDLEEFKDVITNLFHFKFKNEDQVTALFMKIDSSSDGEINWDEFCTFMQLEYAEKEDSYLRSKETAFTLPAIIAMSENSNSSQREHVIRLCNTADNNFLVVSKDGLVSFWSQNMEFKRMKHAHVENSTKKTKWITDFVLMPHFNKFIISTGDREIQFFELSTFEPYCQITGLETTPLRVDYCSTGQDECIILYGDSQGCVNIFIMNSVGETLRNWKKMPKVEGIASVNIDSVVNSDNARFTCIRWKVHADWVSQLKYYDSLRAVISCSNHPDTALVIGHTMGSTHVESQLRDPTGASKKVQNSTARDMQPRRRMDSDQTVFKVYKGVKTFDFCKEKNVIVTGGMDRLVRLWNPYVPGKPTGLLRGHTAPIFHLFICPEDDRIFSVATDKTVKVWDLHDHTCLLTVRPKAHKIRGDLAAIHYNYSSRGLAVATSEQIALLPLKSRNSSKDMITTHKEPVMCVRYNKSFKHVVTASESSVIKVWDLETGRSVFEFSQAHGDHAVTCMSFDSTERRLITGGRDGRLRIWNYNNGHCLRTLEKKSDVDEVADLTYLVLNKNRYIISVGWDRRINLFSDDNEDFHHVQHPYAYWKDDLVNGHKEDILSIAVSPPNLLATSSYDGEIIIWNQISGHIFCHIHSPRASRENGEISSRDLDGGNAIGKILFLKARAMKKDAATLVASGPQGLVHFWNIYTGGTLYATFCPSRNGVTTMTSVAKDTRLVTADSAGFISIWDVEDYCMKTKTTEPPERLFFWRAHVQSITSIEPVDIWNCEILLTASLDCTVRLWTMEGHFVGTLGQPKIWDIRNPVSYQHPMAPYDVLVDPHTLPNLPKKYKHEETAPDDTNDTDIENELDSPIPYVPSFQAKDSLVIDEKDIAAELKKSPWREGCGKRLRHERLKKVPRDMGGPNAYQTLTCFELEDTPPLPNPPSSSSIDDPFDIRI
ncbi:WD repeat-containing protein 49-like [Orbicella faveolata]|uniref:WD repeat-containing protein 49-like n=1 Tax=Orbicella faveolata TaxID=48498 RepID=UPI0009E5C74B|nr:WD repeat-containing protein 49-like [Orbicella faveolata]